DSNESRRLPPLQPATTKKTPSCDFLMRQTRSPCLLPQVARLVLLLPEAWEEFVPRGLQSGKFVLSVRQRLGPGRDRIGWNHSAHLPLFQPWVGTTDAEAGSRTHFSFLMPNAYLTLATVTGHSRFQFFDH